MFRNILLLFFTINLILTAQNKLKSKFDYLLKGEFFNSSSISVDAFDLTSGSSLVQINQNQLMHPASNLKLFTAAASLILGENLYFHTDFYYTGNIIDSVLMGNLFVSGNGDPDFNLAELDSLTGEIKKAGVTKIIGNLYGDVSIYDSLYWGKGWMWDDDPSSDSPYLTPLVINNSVVKVFYSPGNLGEPAIIKTIPQGPFVKVINKSITVSDDTSDIKVSRDWISRKDTIEITGQLSVSAKPDSQEINVYNPSKYFLKNVKHSFRHNGINILGITDFHTLPDSAKLLISYKRNSIAVLKNLNKESKNLSAESLLRLLALKYFGKPASAENGVKVIDSLITLLKFDPNEFRIVDGSGLSHYNLITTKLMISLLKYLYNNSKKNFYLIYDSLPVAGIDGTLKNRMKDGFVFKNVHAKTGFLSGISTLSGYLKNRNNHLIAFSIFIQNFVGKPDSAKSIQDNICRLLSEFN